MKKQDLSLLYFETLNHHTRTGLRGASPLRPNANFDTLSKYNIPIILSSAFTRDSKNELENRTYEYNLNIINIKRLVLKLYIINI